MLEIASGQSANALWYAGTRPLHMLSVLPSGEAADTQDLLQACAVLQQLGYPVVVLDGTEAESDDAPGLRELMQPRSGFSHTALPVGNQAHIVATLPAAFGLVQLVQRAKLQSTRPLELLYRHLRNHALVVILAPETVLAPLLQGCQQSPMLMVPTTQHNVVDSYRALKHIFMHTGLMPRLLALRSQDSGLDPVLRTIAQCALHQLHTEPLAEQLDPQHPRQLRRWALQCLEQAEAVHAPQSGDQAAASPLAWSH